MLWGPELRQNQWAWWERWNLRDVSKVGVFFPFSNAWSYRAFLKRNHIKLHNFLSIFFIELNKKWIGRINVWPIFQPPFLHPRSISLSQIPPVWGILSYLRTFAYALYCLEFTHRPFHLADYPMLSTSVSFLQRDLFLVNNLFLMIKSWSKGNRPTWVVVR